MISQQPALDDHVMTWHDTHIQSRSRRRRTYEQEKLQAGWPCDIYAACRMMQYSPYRVVICVRWYVFTAGTQLLIP